MKWASTLNYIGLLFSLTAQTDPAAGFKVLSVQMCWEMLGVWRQPAALLQAGMGTEAASLTVANRLLSSPYNL
jgi:hypothetical protein